MTRVACIAVLLAACAGPQNEEPQDWSEDPDTIPSTMPDFPRLEAGRLTALTGTNNPDYQISGSWEAEAALCTEPDLVQVVARGEGFGTVLLIGPPADSTTVGEYEVVYSFTDIPDTATARVGVQIFRGTVRDHSFRGVEGTVAVERLDTVIVGRLAVRIREGSFIDTVFYAGSFQAPVRNASDEWCEVVGRPRRSTQDTPRTPVRSPRRNPLH